MKSIIVFAVLDNGSIREVMLDKDQKDVIKHTLNLVSNRTIKCSTIDFSEVIQLPENEENS